MKISTAKGRQELANAIKKVALEALPGCSVASEEDKAYRTMTVDILTGVNGVCASIDIDPKHPWFLVHWFGLKGARFSPSFTDSYNEFHGCKATTHATDGAEELLVKLGACLRSIGNNTAFTSTETV